MLLWLQPLKFQKRSYCWSFEVWWLMMEMSWWIGVRQVMELFAAGPVSCATWQVLSQVRYWVPWLEYREINWWQKRLQIFYASHSWSRCSYSRAGATTCFVSSERNHALTLNPWKVELLQGHFSFRWHELTNLNFFFLSLHLPWYFFTLWCVEMPKGRGNEAAFWLCEANLIIDGRSGSRIMYLILWNISM